MRRSRFASLTLVGLLLVTLLGTAFPSSSVLAAGPVYVVDTALNNTLAVTATTCSTAVAKVCSLREDITLANVSGPHEISFDIPVDSVDPDNGYDES
ncbi:MAG: hypothetical protein H7Z42_00285, partial [Roseiflexaceae bacterium]|nr:hypothetical protein [Roseiflexaceae bacterium]